MRSAPLVLCLGIVLACDPGVYATIDDQDDDVIDAAPGGADAAVACEPEVALVDTGYHNPGQPCMNCHAPSAPGLAPDFVLAGTLFVDAAGSAPKPNATIVVTDANGARFELPSADNGNFWSADATIVFPVTVSASLCPETRPMITPVAAGDCNASGCHALGAPTGRIYLP
jgi:hypothetical protein